MVFFLVLIACLNLKSNTFTVNFYRKMNMAKKYTNWYSNVSHQSHKCICKGDFLNVMKNRSRPSFITVDTFVYFKYNEEQYYNEGQYCWLAEVYPPREERQPY